MLRSFDLKQNVNSHAFKEITFHPKTCKNEGKEEVIKKSTEQRHLNTISFKTKCALVGPQIRFYQASSIHTLLTKPAMQWRKKANTEANAKI